MNLSISKIVTTIAFCMMVDPILIYAWADLSNIIVISPDFTPISKPVLFLGIPAGLAFFNYTGLRIMLS